MAATMFGVTSDNYLGRLHVAYDQLEYDEGDIVIYPDLVRNRWMWHQPQGAGPWSGAGTTTAGAAEKLQFLLPANCVSDPHSYRLYFKCYVAANEAGAITTNAGLANYAHSVFRQLTIRFTGGSSSEPEQVLNYNVFCSMLYKFYSTAHVTRIHSSLEGYGVLADVSGNLATRTSAAARAWLGRSFMIPLNVGMFLSARKMIPNFILPTILVEFQMETVLRATAPINTAVVRASPNYYIDTCQLVVRELEVTNQYTDDLRKKVRDMQAANTPLRIDMSSWTSYNVQIPASTNSQANYMITSDIAGMRKIMFGLVDNALETTATTGGDCLNSFGLNKLGNYRFNVGAHYYPDQEIYINPGGAAGNTLNADLALAYYMNAYAVGVLANPGSDIIQNWFPEASVTDAATDELEGGALDTYDYVYMIKTEFDEAGMPSMQYLQKSGQVQIRLNFTSSIGATTLSCYVFINQHRSIIIEEGNRAQVING